MQATDDRYYSHRKHKHKRLRHSESPEAHPRAGRSSEVLDSITDWSKHRSELTRIFFHDNSPIKRGTKAYDDFWKFLQKCNSFTIGESSRGTSIRNVPSAEDPFSNYDPLHKINFTVFTTDIKKLMDRAGVFIDQDDPEALREEHITHVYRVFQLYMDFLQKQRFQKLIKLRKFQKNLPIAEHKEKILNLVRDHQVVLVAGDTGCGKSTQVPQYLLSEGFTGIACTQPRRLACISLCKRVSYETLNEYGAHVGYQIRFEKQKTKHTKILFITEGLLLRQLSSDSMLSSYNVIILDEIHERHLTCDLLLGVIKCLIHQRKDLRVILMSATINIQLFAQYFNNCPVIQVPGRLYPIKVHYSPIKVEDKASKSVRLDPSPYIKILNLIDHKYSRSERGDVLIFLSGMSEISSVKEAAEQYAQQNGNWIVLPLHSSLSLEDQDKVFDYPPENVRKCIISTNIAETSITIDGIRFVVDSGKVKEMSYDSVSHMQKLKEFWISCASAEQRKGRAGRTGPGVCFRMYSESEYESLSPYSTPEIQRVPLNCLLLQLISLGLPDVRKFPFLEPPQESSLEESVKTLKDQSALTKDEELTPMGKILAKLPVDVTVGKILIFGCVFQVVESVLSLAASLSIQSPFTNKAFQDLDARTARKPLDSNHGDPFTLLNAYHEWLSVKSRKESYSRKWCKHRGLEEQRFYEMSKLRQQFKELLKEVGLTENYVEAVSSVERTQRHGELKRLRDLKRQYHKTPRQRKILNLDQEDEEESSAIDIKDVDFHLSHNQSEIQTLLKNADIGQRQLSLLKLVLCSGVYPQISIADDNNSFKCDVDQLFHTKGKGFVVLHPNSVLALYPDALKLDEIDVLTVPDFTSKLPVSAKHQLVAYMSLLETTKPYLINCMRIPAAQFLLLLSSNIDSNNDLTRFIIDEFLEITFPDSEESQSFILKVFCAKFLFTEVLELLLQETFESEKGKFPGLRTLMQRKLRAEVDDILHMEVAYTMKRLLSADLKTLYTKEAGAYINVAAFDDSKYKTHPYKGGLMITDFFTYGCLADFGNQEDQVQKEWKCFRCNKEYVYSVLEALFHIHGCSSSDASNASSQLAEQPESVLKTDASKQAYTCKECGRTLYLTVPEMLYHKKQHQSSKS